MMVVRVGLSNVSKCVLSKYLWLNGKKVGRESKKEEGKVGKRKGRKGGRERMGTELAKTP